MLPNELENIACRMMEDVFDAGHRVRLAAGKNTDEWKSKQARDHLSHAWKHIEAALGSEAEDSELLYLLDEDTKTPHLGNALLRIAMAVTLLREREQATAMRNMKENNDE